MKGVNCKDGKYYGEYNGNEYLINDDSAAYFYDCWQNSSIIDLVNKVINNEELWGEDLKNIDGFEKAVVKDIESLMKMGAINTIKSIEKSAVLI